MTTTNEFGAERLKVRSTPSDKYGVADENEYVAGGAASASSELLADNEKEDHMIDATIEDGIYSVETSIRNAAGKVASFVREYRVPVGVGAVAVGAGVLVATGAFSQIAKRAKTLSTDAFKNNGKNSAKSKIFKDKKKKNKGKNK